MSPNRSQHATPFRARLINPRWVSLQMALSSLVLAGACGGGGDGLITRTPVTPDPAVTVSVSPSPLIVSQGASATLVVSITGGSATTPPTLASCTSATPAIASVAVAGGSCRVTGVTPGTTTITATASTGQSAAANVTVTAEALTSLTLSPSSASLHAGQTLALTPLPITGGAGVSISYTYASSAVGVATVSAGGVVTGVAVGTATITVTASGVGAGVNTSQRTATANITVTTALGVGFGLEQFASIPEGAYPRGATNGVSDQLPVRTISISAFRMQKTEVTQGQWRQVMTGTALANPSFFASCGDTCPVDLVSWDDIQQFLTRLNQQDPGKGYRLPTEAEWEYAARAGTTGDYAITGAVCSFAWVSDNNCAQGRTWPVAQKPANAWSLYDVHGNSWEWVSDWYDGGYYAVSPAANPTGPTSGSSRVNRGGGYISEAIFARSAHRTGNPPSLRSPVFGFRLARTP